MKGNDLIQELTHDPENKPHLTKHILWNEMDLHQVSK